MRPQPPLAMVTPRVVLVVTPPAPPHHSANSPNVLPITASSAFTAALNPTETVPCCIREARATRGRGETRDWEVRRSERFVRSRTGRSGVHQGRCSDEGHSRSRFAVLDSPECVGRPISIVATAVAVAIVVAVTIAVAVAEVDATTGSRDALCDFKSRNLVAQRAPTRSLVVEENASLGAGTLQLRPQRVAAFTAHPGEHGFAVRRPPHEASEL